MDSSSSRARLEPGPVDQGLEMMLDKRVVMNNYY